MLKADLSAGLAHAQGGGPPGGRVGAIAIDPANPATLYAGSFNGGVFKSADWGARWTAINSGLPIKEVRALAIDPSNPATLICRDLWQRCLQEHQCRTEL